MTATEMVIGSIIRLVRECCPSGDVCDTCRLWRTQALERARRIARQPNFSDGQVLTAGDLQRAFYWAAIV